MAAIDKRVDELERGLTRLINDLNRTLDGLAKKVHQMDADRNIWGRRIQMLEGRFEKFDKTAKKASKHLDPRVQKKSMLKMVDQALKAYDKKHK
ncbi:hypothetical protein [uncultured Tateyamaria sp.]|uniref:hypothetical protein n=1 Tax=uncultured Tateyamaria sp. TaxID=455651 RepID=UPI002634CDE7|nr:hypothetical protein [uncultured Tateyamaria sp.]